MDSTVLSLASLALNELEAFVELMFLAAYADGSVSEVERAAFRGQVLKGTHGQLDEALVDQVLLHIEQSVLEERREDLLGSIRERLADGRKRRAALAHAARVVLADGELKVDEIEFLRRAAVALGEPAELAETLLGEVRSSA